MKTEQNKLEQQFKQKLDERLIQPSGAAWDRLDAMLSVAEKKEQKKPVRLWLYVAAACLVALLGCTLFFKFQDNTVIPADVPAVVTSPDIESKETPVKPQYHSIDDLAPAAKTEVVSVIGKTPVKAGAAKDKFDSYERVEQEFTNEAIVENTENALQKKTAITVDPAKLLAAVESGVDAPIAKAEKQTIKVDANSLLSTVEGEMDESFRNKAIKTAIKNFNAVKTSVANRNYQ
jgi:hypothetical protein